MRKEPLTPFGLSGRKIRSKKEVARPRGRDVWTQTEEVEFVGLDGRRSGWVEVLEAGVDPLEHLSRRVWL